MRKKLLILPLATLALGLGTVLIVNNQTYALPTYAETTGSETTESEVIESEVIESELTEEGFIDQTKAFLSQYLDEQLVMSIINWAIDAGLLSILFGVYLKYRKYKSMSSNEIANEVKSVVDNAVKESVDKLTTEQLTGIYKGLENLEKGLDITNKALVLAQDKTAEGKIALLDLISERTKDESVKEAASEVKTKIEQEEKIKEEVSKEVKEDYTSIF